MTEERQQDIQQLEDMTELCFEAIVDTFVNSCHLSEQAFFSKVFDTVFQLIPSAEKGSYYKRYGDEFKPVLSRGYDMAVLRRLSFTEEDLFIGFEVTKPGEIEVYEYRNMQRDDSKFTKEDIETFKALGTYESFTSLYTPIQVSGKNIGLLCCERFDGEDYDKRSKLILKLYAQLISNFYTDRVIKEREVARYKEIIDAMVAAIELKDKYTQGHGARVTELARGLAEYMKLKDEEVEVVATAAILHDIGKIGIHSDILIKPGKLTAEEYALIKEHPAHTKKILSNISDLSQVVDIAYMHHEYYDGRGYPQGLKGDQIPIESAIIAVADAFDAMTSDRSYRKALSREEAYAIILDEKGRQFNPEVVDAFLRWHREKLVKDTH